MYFLIEGRDRTGGFELRMRHRQAHIDYWLALGSQVRLGGPLLVAPQPDADARASLLIIEADTLEEARLIADADPFTVEGVYETVAVSPMRLTLGALLSS